MPNVKVSICCITFNHKDYIREALDSFLSQKTNFDFEILINDDCSTDGTKEILKEYEKNFPEKITVVYHEENMYSQGYRNMMLRYLFPKAKGSYLALCEGDDFWTDENKLQLQYDFLESNLDYSICFHPVKVFYQDGEEPDSKFPEQEFIDKKDFSLNELMSNNFIPTCSIMFRKTSYKDLDLEIIPGDHYMSMIHAATGKIHIIDKQMANYRRHKDGIWIDKKANQKNLDQNVIGFLKLYQFFQSFYKITDEEYIKIFENKVRIYFDFLLEQKKYYKVKECLELFPDFAIIYIKILYFEVNGHFNHIKFLEEKIKHIENENIQNKDKRNIFKKIISKLKK